MSEFNDSELEKLLGRASGAYPDVNIAYAQVQGRVRQARRRRTVVVSGVACSLLFSTALVAANRTDGSEPSQVGDRSSLDATFPDETMDDTANVTDDSVVTTDDVSDDSSSGNSVPETHRGGSTPVTTAHGNGGDTTSSKPTSTTDAPVTTVFSGEGGSITVRLEDGALSLISYSANAGYDVEIEHSGGDRVEVRFESDDHRTRIRIDLEDGAMDPSIEETEN